MSSDRDVVCLLKDMSDPPAKKRKGGQARPGEPLAEWCEIAIAGVCKGRAECRHHKLRRSQGGGDEKENTLDLCDMGGCHDHIHQNPAWAYRMGYLTRSSLRTEADDG